MSNALAASQLILVHEHSFTESSFLSICLFPTMDMCFHKEHLASSKCLERVSYLLDLRNVCCSTHSGVGMDFMVVPEDMDERFHSSISL